MTSSVFIKKILITATILFALMGLFNLIVNPYGEYSVKLIPPATTPMRLIKKRVIDEWGDKPIEFVILGSSRLQELDPRDITEQDGINLSLQNPTMEDVYAIWKYLLTKNNPPKQVALGLEINMFKPGPMDEAGLYAIPELGGLVPWSNREKIVYEYTRFRRLFKLYVFAQSIKQLNNFFTGKKPLLSFDSRGIPFIPGIPPIIVKAEKTAEPPPNVIKTREKKRRETLIWFREVKYRNFDRIGKQNYFEGILADAQRMHIPTLVFLTSMHPEMVELSRKNTPYDAWRKYVKTSCEKYDAAFVDISEYNSVPNLQLWDFIDNAHLSREGVGLVGIKLRTYFNE